MFKLLFLLQDSYELIVLLPYFQNLLKTFAGGGTSRMKSEDRCERRRFGVVHVQNLKEKLKTEIPFVDFICCEGSKFGKIRGNVKNSKIVHFDYLHVFIVCCVFEGEQAKTTQVGQ